MHRSRIVLSLIPLSPLMMLGVADAVIYRRMEGQVCTPTYATQCTGMILAIEHCGVS
jgi:hypothetical protein